MNFIYCKVWSTSLGTWVVASELAKGGKKSKVAKKGLGAVLVSSVVLLSLAGPNAFADTLTPSACAGTGDGNYGPTAPGRDAGFITPQNIVDGSGDYSIVTGCSANGGGFNAVSLFGSGSRVTGHGGSVFGFQAKAGQWGTALGIDSEASGIGSTAAGFGSFATGSNAVAIGGAVTATSGAQTAANAVRAEGSGSVAIGANATRGAQSKGILSIAIGGQALTDALADGAIAIGNNTHSSAVGSVAIGGSLSGTTAGASSAATNAIAIGAQSSVVAAGTSGLALGRGATVNGAFGIAQGDAVVSGATGRNVAIGSTGTTANGSTAAGGAVAIGRGQTATGDGAVAIGDPNTASGTGAVTVGANNSATGQGAIALGNANTASGQGALALGNASSTSGQGAIALGNASSAGAAGAVAMGDGASASIAHSVALGSGATTAAAVGTASTVIRGTTYNFAGTAPTSTVSVGAEDAERTVTNVAAGRLSDSSTDAINGSQLFATNQAVQAAGAGFNVTAQGANGTNVAPSESVDLNNTDGNIVVSKTATDDNVSFDLADDVTVNSVTAGNSRLDTNGLVITGGPSVTATGINAGSQVITNVAAGVAGTDGVNVTQLNTAVSGATTQGMNFTGNDNPAGDVHRDLGQTLSIRGDATTVGTYSGGNLRTVTEPTTGAINVQLADSPQFGNVVINDGGTGKISGVAPADLSAASTDAVNGSQLFQTNEDVAALDNRVTTNEGDITNIKNQMGPTDPTYLQQNGRGTRYARTNDTGLAEDDAHAQGVGSTAVGYNATSSAVDAVAIGRNSQASHAGSVALGAGSVANGSTLGNAAYLVGGTATGEVNVGNRRVTGVAAGSQDTDAANIGQLKAVATSATQAEQRSVKYDWNDLDADGEIDPGEVDYSKATLAGPVSTDGGVTGGSKITNLAQGEVSATSTDAVNGAQLYSVAGPSDTTYITQNGRGLRYARTNDTGLAEADAHAQGVGSSAVGYNATASAGNAVAVGRDSVAGHANSVALGAGSSTTVGAQSGYRAAYVGSSNSTGQVQVGGRTIGGVAAGSAADDAVNVAQLQAGVTDAVSQANSYTDTRVDQIAGNVAQYDNRIGAVEGDVNNVKNGSAGLFQVSQDDTTAPTASGANASAGGAGAVASGTGSTALGNGAIASAGNAVALGAGSVANQEGTVSVGSAGSERRVTNVAAGTADTDAVNVSQLKGFTNGGLQYDKNADGSNNTNSLTFNPNGSGQTALHNVAAGTAPTDAVNVGQLRSGMSDAVVQANSYTDGQVAAVRNDVWNLSGDVQRLERDMYSGIATAISIKPAPYVAGRTTYYAGFGGYKGEVAMGISLRRTAVNGRWSLEGGASSDRNGIGAYVGVSGVLGD